MIKIIFFDVDGTLLRMGEKNISDKTLYALKALKKKGILLCMATGRSYPEIPHFDGVDFDILSTFNGSYIVRDEDVIYKNPLNNTDKNMLIQNLKKMNRAIAISNENIIVANGTDPDLEQYFLFGNVELIISDNFHGRGRVTMGKSVIIGIAQGIAVTPGISRSGTTIAVSCMLGIERDEAAEFSFLLSVPAILGAMILQLKDVTITSAEMLIPYGAGMIAAFVSGFIVIGVMMAFIRKAQLKLFAVYCLLLGLFVVIFL